MARKANVVNALQIAADRGLAYAERHEKDAGAGQKDTGKLELETDLGVTAVEGSGGP